MSAKDPVAVYTPLNFLDSEFERIKGSWFWKTYLRHLENQMNTHVEITLAGASGPTDNLRVAAAMASAYRTALNLPELIRAGKVTFAGQIVGEAPKRGRPDKDEGEDDGDQAS